MSDDGGRPSRGSDRGERSGDWTSRVRRGVSDRSDSISRHGRSILRIARWEVARGASSVDRRTMLLAVVTLLLAGAVSGAAVTGGGVSVDQNIYRVGVAADSPYRPPVASSSALAARPPDQSAFQRGELDLLVTDSGVRSRSTQKSQAALATFRDAVRAYNDRRLEAERNQSAAFPVVVTLRYDARSGPTGSTRGEAGASSGETDTGGTLDGGASDGSDADADSDGADDASGGQLSVPDVGSALPVLGGSQSGSPADIAPPFPFASLVLAFAFLVPMNFVVQAYGSTMLNERINRRGELLLVAPVAPADIIAGKTAPYFGVLTALTVLIAFAVGGGAVAVAGVLPIALLFLAATFVGAMFARSFKELTFVTVTVSVGITTYSFVPAIFTNVTPIALISPLTLVVRDIQGVAVTPGQYAFATGPAFLSASVLFLLGAGVYREEDLFTQRRVTSKYLDALDSRIGSVRSMATLSVLSLPFVFVGELLVIAVLFALPIGLSLPVLLVAIAAVEELAKSTHVYAGFQRDRFDRSVRVAAVLGAVSGFGFFLGEKATLAVQVVGLSDLALGRAAFATGATDGTGAVVLLLAPLVLHATTTTIAAIGAARGPRGYLGGLGVATLVHASYNLTVVSALG